jgi:hypothetical protein
VATGIRRGLGSLRRRRQPTGADVITASAALSSILNLTFTAPRPMGTSDHVACSVASSERSFLIPSSATS